MSSAFDVAVVGAGVVGAAVAYECAERGARVVLLERGEPGREASGAAAGMLAPCSEAHTAGPFLDMARESLRLWPSFARRVQEDGGVDPELVLDGLLRVATGEQEAAAVRDRLHWQAGAGIAEGRWVDAGEARELEPALREDVVGAAWYAGEGHVNSRRAVEALVRAAQARGAVVRVGAEVVGPAVDGARQREGAEAPATARSPAGVRLADGTQIHADNVVLAGGAWVGRLAAAFGSPLPVRPVHGQVIGLRGLPLIPRRVLFAGLQGYAVAKRDGTVLVGATEEERGFDASTHDDVSAALHARAARLIEGAAQAHVAHAWAGLRPCSPDGLPLLGPLPGCGGGGVHVAGGHYRNGVLLAPATAIGMAQLLLDGVSPPGWAAFDPRRLA